MRDSFVFYGSWYEAIKGLPAKVKAEVMEAIMRYALYGEQVQTNNAVVKTIFTLIKPQIDTNNKRYENGMRGGQTKREPNVNQTRTKVEPNKNQTITKREPNVNQSRTKQEPNDNVYDNDNVYVYDDGEEEENKEEVSPPPPPQEEIVIINNQSAVMPMATLDDEIAAMLGNAEWVETTRMRFHVRDPSAFETMLQNFRQDCVCRGLERHDNIRDAMSHFCNWLMKKQEVEQEKQRKDENSRRDNCSKQEANRYAIEQLAAAKQRAELGIDDTPNPF